MQTIFLFRPTVSTGRGCTPTDAKIRDSGLAALIEKIFSDLQFPSEFGGCTKLQQQQDNRDAFDLYFYSNVHSDEYDIGGTYTAPDIAVFERTDFEDFPHTEHECRRRLQEFARRLVSGELQRANYE